MNILLLFLSVFIAGTFAIMNPGTTTPLPAATFVNYAAIVMSVGIFGLIFGTFSRIVAGSQNRGTDVLVTGSVLFAVFGLGLGSMAGLGWLGFFAAAIIIAMATVVAVRTLKLSTTMMQHIPILAILLPGLASVSALAFGWEWVHAASFSMVGWPLAFANFSNKRAIAPVDTGSVQAG